MEIDAPVAPGSESAGELLLRAGEPYRARALGADRARILATYRNAGYLDATVEPELRFTEDRSEVTVIFHVVPGPLVLVGQVVIAGLERTQERVVSRELPLEPGQPLSLEKLLEGQKRLAGLGLFERVSLTPLEGGERPERDVLVGLSEASVTTVAYGAGYSERDLFRGSVEVTRRNLFGLDRTLTAFARAAFRGRGSCCPIASPGSSTGAATSSAPPSTTGRTARPSTSRDSGASPRPRAGWARTGP